MIHVFADTFYFLALLNAKDTAHHKAMAFSQLQDVPLLTTAWVLTELADAPSSSVRRHAFHHVLSGLKADPETIIVPASQNLFERGIDLYTARPDKDWSLTDCISFTVMEQYGVRDALTGDHHFAQAGYEVLLS